jgi:hypothetical protein
MSLSNWFSPKNTIPSDPLIKLIGKLKDYEQIILKNQELMYEKYKTNVINKIKGDPESVITETDSERNTPLHLVTRKRYPELMYLIINTIKEYYKNDKEYGEDSINVLINAHNDQGYSPLDLTIMDLNNPYVEGAKILIQNGADPDKIPNNEYRTTFRQKVYYGLMNYEPKYMEVGNIYNSDTYIKLNQQANENREIFKKYSEIQKFLPPEKINKSKEVVQEDIIPTSPNKNNLAKFRKAATKVIRLNKLKNNNKPVNESKQVLQQESIPILPNKNNLDKFKTAATALVSSGKNPKLSSVLQYSTMPRNAPAVLIRPVGL